MDDDIQRLVAKVSEDKAMAARDAAGKTLERVKAILSQETGFDLMSAANIHAVKNEQSDLWEVVGEYRGYDFMIVPSVSDSGYVDPNSMRVKFDSRPGGCNFYFSYATEFAERMDYYVNLMQRWTPVDSVE